MPRDPRDLDAHRLLGLHAHAWVIANINMADNKAGFIVFGTAALAAYLRPAVAAWMEHPGVALPGVLPVLAMALLVASSLCAVVVVAPRARGAGRSLTYWGGIAAHGDAESYVRAVGAQSAEALNQALLTQVYVISELAVRKFLWLRWAMWLAGAGFLLVLSAALVS